jgi:DNA repair exonuclease SbcCD ATPase subunit
MWVLKRSEGSVNYIVFWAIVGLLLTIGLFGIFLSFLYFFTDISTILETTDAATTLLAVSLILVFTSLILSFRQVRLYARLRRLNQVRSNARSGLRLAESMGIDTKRADDLYKVAEAHVGFRKLREPEAAMADCTAILESQLTLHADRLLDKTKSRMELKRDSTGVMFKETSLDPIEREIENGDYREVSRLLRAHRITSDRIEGLWFALRKAKRLGIPIEDDLRELKDVLMEFNRGDFSDARVGAMKARDSLDALITEHVKETYVVPAYQKINSLGTRGIHSDEAQQLLAKAGTNLLASNVENSIKMANLGGSKIDDATKSAINESFEKLEDVASRAEGLGVDVSSYPHKVDIARNDMEEGRLEKSLDVLRNAEMSMIKEMNFLVVGEFAPLRKSVDTLFLVPEAKLELVESLEAADGERKKGNFEEAMQLAEKLSNRIQTERKESLRAIKSSTKKLAEKMKELESKGVPTKKIQKAIKASQETASQEDYAKAMETILNVTEIVNRNLALHKDSVRTLEELSTLLSRAKDKGVNVTDLRKKMKALEKITDREKVITNANEIEDLALQRMTDTAERSAVELMKMRDQLHSLLEQGVEVGDVPKLIGEAEKAVDDENFKKAQKVIKKAEKQLETAIDLSERFDDRLAQIEETFTLLDTAGIPTTVFESDLQNIITQRSEDTFEELTRFLDEVSAEKDRMKSQARETIEESRAMVQDNPGISFDEENEIMEKATEAYDSGRFSKAFEVAVEAVGRTKKKVELFNNSTEACEKLSEDITRLGEAGYDAHKLESELQICEMEEDPSVRLERVRALEDEVQKTEKKLVQKMEWAVVEARHGISLLQGNEVSSDDLSEMLDSAQVLVEEQRYRDAEKKARNIRDLAEERIGQFRESKEKMASLEHIMTRAKEMNVSLDEFEEDISWLESSDDYSHMIEKAGLLFDRINNLFEDKRDGLRETISRLKETLLEMENSGILAPSVREALEKAELEMSGDSIIEAMDTCDLADERIAEVRKAYSKWTGALLAVDEALDEATQFGIGVKDFVTRMDTLRESPDYESSIPELDKILDDLNYRKTSMSTKTLEDIQSTREKLENLIEDGAAGGDLMDLLKRAEKDVQEEEYLSARQNILEVARATEQLKNDHESFMTVLEEVKSEVEEVAESGMDVSMIMDELEELRGSEYDYKSRLQLVRDLGEKATGIADSLGQEASQVMSEARNYLDDLKAKGLSVGDAESLLLGAEDMMGEGNTFEAKRLAIEAKTLAEEFATLADEKEVAIKRAKQAIQDAAVWGVNISGLGDDLEEALKTTDGSEALQKLRIVAEEADSLRMSMSEDSGANLDGLRMEVQELKNKGIPVSNLDAVMSSAENLMGEGKVDEANELIEALKKEKSELEELHSDHSSIMEQLDGEMENMEVRKNDMESIERERKDAESLGLTKEGIERTEVLLAKVVKVKEVLRESTETRLGEVRDFINELRNKGAEVEEAVSVLYEAEEILADDGYLKALAKINRAADVGEGINQRHAFDNNLLETEELLKVANEEGVEVEDLMDELENLRERDDFEQMTETLKSIEEETNKRRNGAKD